MSSHMNLHNIGPAKLLLADPAGKWSFTRVRSHVGNEATTLCKLLLANITLIRTLAGMRSSMVPI